MSEKELCLLISFILRTKQNCYTLKSFLGFPGGSVVKNLPAHAGDVGSIPGLGKALGRREWQPTPLFLPGNSHGQRSLAGFSPWGCSVRHD